MSRPLDIETAGGGGECFSVLECPVYKMLLQHLGRAPFSNVYEQRIEGLQKKFSRLLQVNRRNSNATLTCIGVGCPIYHQDDRRFKIPVVRIRNLRSTSFRRPY